MRPPTSEVSINTPDGDDESWLLIGANTSGIQDAESRFGLDTTRGKYDIFRRKAPRAI